MPSQFLVPKTWLHYLLSLAQAKHISLPNDTELLAVTIEEQHGRAMETITTEDSFVSQQVYTAGSHPFPRPCPLARSSWFPLLWRQSSSSTLPAHPAPC